MQPVSIRFVSENSAALSALLCRAKSKKVPDGFDPEHMIIEAIEDRALIWPIQIDGKISGVMATTILEWPKIGRIVAVQCLGGDGLLPHVPKIKRIVALYRDRIGAKLAVTQGREGWSKPLGLKPVGYLYHLWADED
jgi:hypothetical protein